NNEDFRYRYCFRRRRRCWRCCLRAPQGRVPRPCPRCASPGVPRWRPPRVRCREGRVPRPRACPELQRAGVQRLPRQWPSLL
ncbi:hypothetical protein LPJ59_003786, partial [Coemansia sp. RSA 2399]